MAVRHTPAQIIHAAICASLDCWTGSTHNPSELLSKTFQAQVIICKLINFKTRTQGWLALKILQANKLGVSKIKNCQLGILSKCSPCASYMYATAVAKLQKHLNGSRKHHNMPSAICILMQKYSLQMKIKKTWKTIHV
jgi:hypothetical protein